MWDYRGSRRDENPVRGEIFIEWADGIFLNFSAARVDVRALRDRFDAPLKN